MPSNEETRALADRIILLGDEADEFWRSDLGKYLISKASQKMEDAMVSLAEEIDPKDFDKIREAQNEVSIAKNTLSWIQEVIESGRDELNNRLREEEEDIQFEQ